jgi:hypothetical protein
MLMRIVLAVDVSCGVDFVNLANRVPAQAIR